MDHDYRMTKRAIKIRNENGQKGHTGEPGSGSEGWQMLKLSVANESELLPACLSHQLVLPSKSSHRGLL
jgi:hypothetical protein